MMTILGYIFVMLLCFIGGIIVTLCWLKDDVPEAWDNIQECMRKENG